MRTASGLVKKVGFVAIGVGAGIILAAGSGFAAIQLSRNAAGNHSISAVQTASSQDKSVNKASPSVSGADDKVAEVRGREPELTDDRTSKPAPTSGVAASRAPEPGDDRGRGGRARARRR